MTTASAPDLCRETRGSKERDIIERMWNALDAHFRFQGPVPARTAKLAAAGDTKMAKKIIEEAGEVALAATVKDRDEVIAESADLLYHLVVTWASLGICPEDVWNEMTAREAAYGLAEKRAKATVVRQRG
jgi:phosphoribosyl-ATP pyrophosphohydrolase